MAFRESLTTISTALPETYLVTLMDRDGISVDAVSGPDPGIDIQACLIELSNLFAQIERSSEQLATGAVDELLVQSDKLSTVIRRIGSEYFLALAFAPSGSAGKARYLLRVAAPKLARELLE